jgi:hypothetical protein
MSYNTAQEWLNAVVAKPSMFRNVPGKFRTKEVCTTAVMRDVSLFAYVPSSMQTEELCMFVVQSYPEMLQHILYPSFAVQTKAVSKDPSMIRFVDEKTQESIVSMYPKSIEYIDFPSDEVCITAVRADPSVERFLIEKSPEVLKVIAEIAKNTKKAE